MPNDSLQNNIVTKMSLLSNFLQSVKKKKVGNWSGWKISNNYEATLEMLTCVLCLKFNDDDCWHLHSI